MPQLAFVKYRLTESRHTVLTWGYIKYTILEMSRHLFWFLAWLPGAKTKNTKCHWDFYVNTKYLAPIKCQLCLWVNWTYMPNFNQLTLPVWPTLGHDPKIWPTCMYKVSGQLTPVVTKCAMLIFLTDHSSGLWRLLISLIWQLILVI
jgi:hypothetical protein